MERRILIGIFRPKHVDNLQKWSRIFRSEETETDLPFEFRTKFPECLAVYHSVTQKNLEISDGV